MDKRRHLQNENLAKKKKVEYWESQIKVLQLQGLKIDILLETSGNSLFTGSKLDSLDIQ